MERFRIRIRRNCDCLAKYFFLGKASKNSKLYFYIVLFWVAKATLHSQISNCLSVSMQNPSNSLYPSSFIIKPSSFTILRLLNFSACSLAFLLTFMPKNFNFLGNSIVLVKFWVLEVAVAIPPQRSLWYYITPRLSEHYALNSRVTFFKI